MDAEIVLPGASHRSFWWKGGTWKRPTYDNAEGLVARLSREDLIGRDTDARGEWFIERSPDGAHWLARPGEADVTISGPVKLLLLILTRRRRWADGTDQISVDGDLDLVRQWIQHTAHMSG